MSDFAALLGAVVMHGNRDSLLVLEDWGAENGIHCAELLTPDTTAFEIVRSRRY